MTSTSDSENEVENLARMRDSVDTELLHDGLFNGEMEVNNTQALVQLPSLRFQKTEEDNWIHTTPAFRAYVAKLLVKQLDASLDKDLVNLTTSNSTSPATAIKNRVKLFRTSKKCIKIENNVSEVPIKRKSGPELNYDELENNSRLVAVNGIDILEMTETKAWSTRTKAPVVKYIKLKDGTVVEKCTFIDSVEK